MCRKGNKVDLTTNSISLISFDSSDFNIDAVKQADNRIMEWQIL